MLFCDGLLRSAIFLLEWNFFRPELLGAQKSLALAAEQWQKNIFFEE
jgi:hypothetical protein